MGCFLGLEAVRQVDETDLVAVLRTRVLALGPQSREKQLIATNLSCSVAPCFPFFWGVAAPVEMVFPKKGSFVLPGSLNN